MSELIVPLQAIPQQTLQIQLGNQPCTITLQQMAYGLFMTLYVGTSLIVGTVFCQNLNRIVRSDYLGFSGDFMFMDRAGDSNPVYTGLGDQASQYQLLYIPAEDLPEAS